MNAPLEPPSEPAKTIQNQSIPSDRAVYNVITDTFTGVNVRWSDNKFQAIFVLASIAIASVIGAILAAVNTSWKLPWYGGGLIGSFLGLVIGIIASGIFLMIYRAIRHFKGKHD